MAEIKSLKERIAAAVAHVPASVNDQLQQQLELLAESNVAPGLTVGERAPDFTLPNRFGNSVSLSRELMDGPVVLSFLRGSWCPICTQELQALQEVRQEIRKLGADIIAVSPQSVEKNIAFGAAHSVDYYVLSDADQAVIRQYKLHFTIPERLREIYIEHFRIDLSQQNADGSWALPVPATYIISRDGTIYSRLVEMNYLKRMEPADILTVLRYMK